MKIGQDFGQIVLRLLLLRSLVSRRINLIIISERLKMTSEEQEQRLRDLQRSYVDFLDDSDDQGIYSACVRLDSFPFSWPVH